MRNKSIQHGKTRRKGYGMGRSPIATGMVGKKARGGKAMKKAGRGRSR